MKLLVVSTAFFALGALVSAQPRLVSTASPEDQELVKPTVTMSGGSKGLRESQGSVTDDGIHGTVDDDGLGKSTRTPVIVPLRARGSIGLHESQGSVTDDGIHGPVDDDELGKSTGTPAIVPLRARDFMGLRETQGSVTDDEIEETVDGDGPPAIVPLRGTMKPHGPKGDSHGTSWYREYCRAEEDPNNIKHGNQYLPGLDDLANKPGIMTIKRTIEDVKEFGKGLCKKIVIMRETCSLVKDEDVGKHGYLYIQAGWGQKYNPNHSRINKCPKGTVLRRELCKVKKIIQIPKQNVVSGGNMCIGQ